MQKSGASSVFLSSHDTTPSLLLCPRQLRHIQPRLCTTIWTNCSDRPCRNRQKYPTIASSDMPRSRRISREICGTHGAEVVDACTLIFSGLKDRSILTAKPFRLPLLIAAFLQKWPNAPAEHWLDRWDCNFVWIKNDSSEMTRVGIMSTHGEHE